MIYKRRQFFAILFIFLITNIFSQKGFSIESQYWTQIPLDTDEILLDIGFVPDEPNRGWILGTRNTLLETFDNGLTWSLKFLNLENEQYRLNSISFIGTEGWIVGKPNLLLYTKDGGSSWTRISLNNELPGNPILIYALDTECAELVTDLGAIYETANRGQTWKAKLTEPVGVIRNITRSSNGSYVAVSAKGNFYSTWVPGDARWVSHPRQSSRRIQNMGFTYDNKLWMLTRGGQVWFNKNDLNDADNGWISPKTPEGKVGFSVGLLNLSYKTPTELWISGGSGNLLFSLDGGEIWQKDKSTENIASNFYKINFINEDIGFVLGNRGTLLRYKTIS
uniref:Photosystem II assembly protein Ycf48 n=1 Tax=Gloeochaete wittrockiana TaxID=38269 RepID=A0A3G1IWA5_9EUKA|nr:photosynthesis system II assembly factor Ycf48 [Gloeochaete wittrockiana]ASQ40242.1 photosynthesis system II assembly factor Ycf48 [Gloeochaete wittrockiana]